MEMPLAKLKLVDCEIDITSDVTTIGRTSDNVVAFPEDSNVSRYHAEIERRGEDHYLIDLNSSNGTTVNGQKLEGEIRLENGDCVAFGGSSEAEFVIGEAAQDEAEAEAANANGSPTNIPGGSEAGSEMGAMGSRAESELGYVAGSAIRGGISGTASGAAPAAASNSTFMVAGIVCGLAVVCLVAAGAFYYMRGSSCAAKAVIVKPESGDTINAPMEIEVKADDTECVAGAVFTIDGQEFASVSEPPFSATIDPKQFPELSDGADHALEIVLIDSSGEKIPQASGVLLAFETREVTKPQATPEVTQANTQKPKTTAASQVSLVQIQEMSQRLVKQFSGNFAYNVTNKQFLQEVQKKIGEYAQEGYFQRAAAYRDPINVAFVREQNLDAPFGFVLAMSRSKFVATKQGDDEGLWRMTNAFVTANAYNGLCGSETLSDPSQNCAAKSAALYMKAIVFGVFDGDMIYSAATFGKTPQDAGAWKATLPAKRADIWNSIKTAPEREQVLRFFAAGIVSENPQKFGLAKDRPLSELYRVTQ